MKKYFYKALSELVWMTALIAVGCGVMWICYLIYTLLASVFGR